MKMKTGKAYAFLDQDLEEDVLVESMRLCGQRANFPDMSFTVLDDKVNDKYDHERKGLPAKIAETAEATDVYGSVPMNMLKNITGIKPKKAADLRYLIMTEVPNVWDPEEAEPLGQGRANKITAGMLREVLRILGERECLAGKSMFLRATVLYTNGSGRAQPYL